MLIGQGMISCSVCVPGGAAPWPFVFGRAAATGPADPCRPVFWPDVTVVLLVFPSEVAMLPSRNERHADSSIKEENPLPKTGIQRNTLLTGTLGLAKMSVSKVAVVPVQAVPAEGRRDERSREARRCGRRIECAAPWMADRRATRPLLAADQLARSSSPPNRGPDQGVRAAARG